jgi:hypothetical protein
MRRALAALLAACAIAVAAGCGGGSSDGSSTQAATTAPSTATAPATAPSTAPAGDLAALLPPQDAVPGVNPGEATPVPTPRAFVDALYQVDDPARGDARARLEGEGYADGVVRDQTGTDPEAGVALLRSYAIRLRDDAAAGAEAAAAADEVRASPLGTSTDLEVPDVPDAQGLRVAVSQGGVSGQVVFVTFPQGPYVYGIQAVAREGADLPQDEIIRAAQDLAARNGTR